MHARVHDRVQQSEPPFVPEARAEEHCLGHGRGGLAGARLMLGGFRRRLGFEVLEQGFAAVIGDPEDLLKEEIVGDLKNAAALLAQHGEHHVAIDDAALEVLGKKLDGLTQLEGSPHRDEEASGDVADDGPYCQETDAYDSDGTRKQGP